jgi:CXXC-20-CXXC protein
MATCPNCGCSKFPYKLLLNSYSARGWNRPIKCPSCKHNLQVTVVSKLAFALASLVLPFAGIVLVLHESPSIVVADSIGISIAALSIFVIAPTIVQFKLWAPYRYWLPKSRVVGYSVYLLLPIALMVLLFAIAVHYQWGM